MTKELQTVFLNTLTTNKDRIFRICRSYTSDTAEAQDLFQEVTIQLWKSLPSFNHQASIDTWLYRVTLNVCMRAKAVATKRKQNTVPLESISYQHITEEATDNETEKQLVKLSDCIKKLDEADRSLILLHLEGLPYKEIASVLGLSENHIAVKIKRIKNKLLTCIQTSSC